MTDEFIVGGEIDRLEIALRVRGLCSSPDIVTTRLGREPTSVAVKETSRGTHMVWMYEIPKSTEWELGDAIETLLSLFPAAGQPWDELAAKFELDVFCGLFLHQANRGTELRPHTLDLLAARHITLSLDIYGPVD